MDMSLIRGLSTLVLFVAFIGMVIWAYSKKRKSDFNEAANLPFVGDETSTEIQHADHNNHNTAKEVKS